MGMAGMYRRQGEVQGARAAQTAGVTDGLAFLFTSGLRQTPLILLLLLISFPCGTLVGQRVLGVRMDVGNRQAKCLQL